MISSRVRLLVCVAFVWVAVLATGSAVVAQTSNTAREDDTNLNTQLYLILATNREGEEGRMPPSLQPVLTQLHDTLAFKHYSMAATFLNRVKNAGQLEMTWVGGPLLVPASSPLGNPSFNQFTALVRLVTDGAGREVVRMTDFRFGSRVPIVTAQTTTTNASTNSTGYPVINYEPVGLRTDISMKEGVPIIAGTLNVGPSGDAIIVVISAKRAGN